MCYSRQYHFLHHLSPHAGKKLINNRYILSHVAGFAMENDVNYFLFYFISSLNTAALLAVLSIKISTA